MSLGVAPNLPLHVSLVFFQEKLLALEIAEKPYDVVKQTFEAALAVGFAGASKSGFNFLFYVLQRHTRQPELHHLF